MKRPFLERSVEKAALMKSDCWMCGVTEEYVRCGKAVAAILVFPNIQFFLSFERSHFNSQKRIVKGKPHVYALCILRS
jgi:hypothetical protein